MLEFGFRCAFSLLGGISRQLPVLIFHRVLSQPDPLLPGEPDTTEFRRQIRWLKRTFHVRTVKEAAAALFSGTLAPRTVCVTFDDGYQDNVTNALPILQQEGVRATFFVTTGFMHGGMMWNDRVIAAVRHWPDAAIDLRPQSLGIYDVARNRSTMLDRLLSDLKHLPFATRDELTRQLLRDSRAVAEALMMGPDGVRALHAAGMEIGGHTHNHPILLNLADADARREIESNKRELESIIQQPLMTFAYPNGVPEKDFAERDVALVRALGYRYAVTTAAGVAGAGTDPFRMPRYSPWSKTKARYLAQLLRNALPAHCSG